MSTLLPEWTEADSHALTVDLVARDGHRMPLIGAERRDAIAEMAAAGLPSEVMAMRLRISVDRLHRVARYYGIRLRDREVMFR